MSLWERVKYKGAMKSLEKQKDKLKERAMKSEIEKEKSRLLAISLIIGEGNNVALMDMLEIVGDDGKVMTKTQIKELKYEEVEKILEKILKEIGKRI